MSVAQRIYLAVFAAPVGGFLKLFFWLLGAIETVVFVAICLVFFPIGIPVLLFLIHKHFTSQPVSDRRGSRLATMDEAHHVLLAKKARRARRRS